MSGRSLYLQGYIDLVLVRSKEKRPAKNGWIYNRPGLGEVTQWSGNMGLIAEHTPAVDIDLYDEDLAEEIQQLAWKYLGRSPLRLSHRPASRLLPYRTRAPFKKKVLTLPDGKGKVEILGAGQQYLVHGTHPEGTDYTWAGSDLWDIPRTKLTEVTETQVINFLKVLQETYGGNLSDRRQRKEHEGEQKEDRAPSLAHLTEALRAIPNNDDFLQEVFGKDSRDAWLDMAHAVYGAGGAAAEDLFVEWSLTWEDGDNNPDYVRQVYQSCHGAYMGWSNIDHMVRTYCVADATDDFDADLGELPEPPVVYADTVPLTDEYILERLLPDLRDRAVNIAGAWHAWDGTTWRRDETQEFPKSVRTLLRPLCLAYNFQAITAGKEEGKVLRATARKYSNVSGINAVTTLASQNLSQKMDAFDNDLMALNTPAGIVDLRTGRTGPSRPEERHTRCTSVAPADQYIPAEAPRWESFLDHLTGGDSDLAAFIQRWCGYSLTGMMGEKKLVFVYGANTNTGKSTFINAITNALGTYGRTTDVGTFMGTKENTDSLAQLPGVRLATATEASAGQRWDDKLVKAITGGDEIEARMLFKSYFSFRPQFKMMIAGNHPPALKNVDDAMLRRVLIVPMDRQVSEEDMDRELGFKLQEEAPHILRWMVEGCLAWQEEGLNPPEAVQAATQEYADDADTMGRWLKDNCEVGDPDAWMGSTDLFHNWKQWNATRGVRSRDEVGTINPFVRALKVALKDTDANAERRAQGNGFVGIALKPRAYLGTDITDFIE